MNFSCNQCQRRYSIADEKVRGKTVKIRCKNCQYVISVEGPPAEFEESTRVVSLADVERLREQDRSLAEEEAARGQGVVSASSWEDEPTRAMPVGDAAAPWFVMVKSKQEGPLDDGALRELVAQGTVTARSYFWQQGMADWKRGQDLPALEGLFLTEEPEPPSEPIPPPEPSTVVASSTSWQPEPPPESQTSWRTASGNAPRSEPTPPPSPALRSQPSTPWESPADAEPLAASDAQAAAAPLGELFSDLDLPASEARDGGHGVRYPEIDDEPTPVNQELEPVSEPPGKARAGAARPPRRRGVGAKLLLVLLLLVLLPVGLVIALTQTGVIPLRVQRTDARGQTVDVPVSLFTPEGIEALRNVLTGQQSPPPPAPPAAAPRQDAEPPAAEPPAETQAEAPPEPEPAAQAPAETPPGTTPEPPAPAPSETPADVGSAPAAQVPTSEGTEELDVAPLQLSGPPRVEVDRVVERSRPSFKPCIAQVLRKNPKLRNGKLLIITTVTHSGEVTKVAMDRPDIGTSPSAECFIERAQRMVFPAFEGDDVEVEIPLVLSRS